MTNLDRGDRVMSALPVAHKRIAANSTAHDRASVAILNRQVITESESRHAMGCQSSLGGCGALGDGVIDLWEIVAMAAALILAHWRGLEAPAPLFAPLNARRNLSRWPTKG